VVKKSFYGRVATYRIQPLVKVFYMIGSKLLQIPILTSIWKLGKSQLSTAAFTQTSRTFLTKSFKEFLRGDNLANKTAELVILPSN
jgi:hypothetical protein